MSILSRLFKSSVQKSLAQMISQTDVIQAAIYAKLSSLFQAKYGNDRGLTIAAAVANKLLAKVSPQHSAEDLQLAEQLAADIIKTDSEIKYASIMACRARMLFEAEKNTDEKWAVWDTIQWMTSVCQLPPDQATPTIIRELATTLYNKYLQNK